MVLRVSWHQEHDEHAEEHVDHRQEHDEHDEEHADRRHDEDVDDDAPNRPHSQFW